MQIENKYSCFRGDEEIVVSVKAWENSDNLPWDLHESPPCLKMRIEVLTDPFAFNYVGQCVIASCLAFHASKPLTVSTRLQQNFNFNFQDQSKLLLLFFDSICTEFSSLDSKWFNKLAKFTLPPEPSPGSTVKYNLNTVEMLILKCAQKMAEKDEPYVTTRLCKQSSRILKSVDADILRECFTRLERSGKGRVRGNGKRLLFEVFT